MAENMKRAAVVALQLALRPVVRIMLRSGVIWKEAADILKATYVDVASRDFGLGGRPTNISRVAIMTGITRREVRRLRDSLDDGTLGSGRFNNATRVLTGWHLDPDYLAPGGKARLLDFDAEGPSFSKLSRKYASDIPPTTLLKELMQVGAVETTESGKLRVLKRYYMPVQMDTEAVMRAGSVLGDLGATINYNLVRTADQQSRFEGRAANLRVRIADVPEFRAFLEIEGEGLLERADAWLSAREDHDRQTPASELARIGVGIYQIHEEQ